MKRSGKIFCAALMLLVFSTNLFAAGGSESGTDVDAPLKLTIMFDGITWTKASKDINGSDELKAWEELTNTELTYITPPHANFAEKVNLYFASGDMPDIVGSMDGTYLPQLVDSGNVMDITGYMEGPMGKEFFEKSNLEENDLAGYTLAGKVYGFPTLRALSDASTGFMLRKDWLNAVGMENPQTLEQYREVLNAFTFDDPDGNGKDDTYGITGRSNFSWMPDGFMGAFGLWGTPRDIVYEVENGKVSAQSTQEKYKDFLRYMRTLVSEDKVVVPNGLLNTSDQWKQDMFGQTAGMWWHSSTRIDEYFMTNMKKANPDWEAEGLELDFLIPPLGPDGHGGGMNQLRAPGCMIITTAAKEPEQAFQYLVNAYTDPVLLDFGKYGLEGTHHIIVDGKKALNPDAKLDERLHQVRGMVFLEGKYPVDDEIISFHWGERALEAYKSNSIYNTPYNGDFLGKPLLEEESTYADLGTTKLEYSMKIVLGTIDFESGWEDFQQALKDGGIEKVEAAYQRWYDEK